LTALACAVAASSVSLTKENYDDLTAGKNAFVKFQVNVKSDFQFLKRLCK